MPNIFIRKAAMPPPIPEEAKGKKVMPPPIPEEAKKKRAVQIDPVNSASPVVPNWDAQWAMVRRIQAENPNTSRKLKLTEDVTRPQSNAETLRNAAQAKIDRQERSRVIKDGGDPVVENKNNEYGAIQNDPERRMRATYFGSPTEAPRVTEEQTRDLRDRGRRVGDATYLDVSDPSSKEKLKRMTQDARRIANKRDEENYSEANKSLGFSIFIRNK